MNGFPEKALPTSADETTPVLSSSPPLDGSGRVPVPKVRNTAGLLRGDRLPPIGTLLARPLLLGLCALLGAIGGFLLTAGAKDSAATTTIVFATLPNGNRDLVALEGATLQRTIAPEWVLERAAISLGEQSSDLEPHTTVVWQEGTRLLNVTTTASSGDQAVRRANAVAEAAVNASDEARNERLEAAVREANSLLADAPLADPDAEIARRNQIGALLGERQNEIQAESMSLLVISPAVKAMSVGLSAMKGAAIGLVAGLLAGAIVSVLLGARGLRVPASGAMRRLAPDIDVLSTSDLPKVAGQLIDSGETLVVVVATRGASLSALALSESLQRLLTARGESVSIASADQSQDLSLTALQRVDAPRADPSRHTSPDARVDTSLVLLNVEEGTEAASMFEGRAGFNTVIVVRRRKTPLSSALAAHSSFVRTRPFVIVASKPGAAN